MVICCLQRTLKINVAYLIETEENHKVDCDSSHVTTLDAFVQTTCFCFLKKLDCATREFTTTKVLYRRMMTVRLMTLKRYKQIKF